MWKSTSASGAPDNSSLSHFSVMTRPSWLDRAVRNRHRHAIEQASRRWRGGRRDDSARTRRDILISTQPATSLPPSVAAKSRVYSASFGRRRQPFSFAIDSLRCLAKKYANANYAIISCAAPTTLFICCNSQPQTTRAGRRLARARKSQNSATAR